MNFQYGEQISVESLTDLKLDLFLLGINHEERVLTAYNKVAGLNSIQNTTGFCYNDDPETDMPSNINQLAIRDHSEIIGYLDLFVDKYHKKKILNIVVDYSCMTKSWYYTIILYFNKKNIDLLKINIFFIYTPSLYTEPLAPKPNSEIAPLPGKYFIPNDKPKILIACLGYEQNKAQGIIEHLDPKECYIFYSKPALDDQFVERLEKNNSEILSRYSNIITYPFNDLVFLERELTSLYQLLKDKYSIIIAPLGPKPFTFISMLLSVRYKDIDIWRVGSGFDINKYKRPPIKNEFILSKIVYTKIS